MSLPDIAAAILRIDTTKLSLTTPLNVQTEDLGAGVVLRHSLEGRWLEAVSFQAARERYDLRRELQRGRFGIGLKTLRRIASDIQVHGSPYHFGSGDGVSIVEQDPEAEIPDFYDPAQDTMLVLELEEDFSPDDFERWAGTWSEDGLIFLEHLRQFRCRMRDGSEAFRETSASNWKAVPCGIEVSQLDHRTVRAGGRSYSVYRAQLPVPDDQKRFHKETAASTSISIATCGRREEAGVFVGFRTRIPTALNVLIDAQFRVSSTPGRLRCAQAGRAGRRCGPRTLETPRPSGRFIVAS